MPIPSERETAMVRIQEKRQGRRREPADDVQTKRDERHSPAEDLKHDLDGILDEIDSLLEENAEEFVKAYVQKGGE